MNSMHRRAALVCGVALLLVACKTERSSDKVRASVDSSAPSVALQLDSGDETSLPIPIGEDGFSPPLRTLVPQGDAPWTNVRVKGGKGAVLLVSFAAYPKDHIACHLSSTGELACGLRRGKAEQLTDGFSIRNPEKIVLRSAAEGAPKPSADVSQAAPLRIRLPQVESTISGLDYRNILKSSPVDARRDSRQEKWVPLLQLLTRAGLEETVAIPNLRAQDADGFIEPLRNVGPEKLRVKLNRKLHWKVGQMGSQGQVEASWAVVGFAIDAK